MTVQYSYYLVSLVSLLSLTNNILKSEAFQRSANSVNFFSPTVHPKSKSYSSPSFYKPRIGALPLLAKFKHHSNFDKYSCGKEHNIVVDTLPDRRQFWIQSTTAIIGYSSLFMSEAYAVEEEMKLEPTLSEYKCVRL